MIYQMDCRQLFSILELHAGGHAANRPKIEFSVNKFLAGWFLDNLSSVCVAKFLMVVAV